MNVDGQVGGGEGNDSVAFENMPAQIIMLERDREGWRE